VLATDLDEPEIEIKHEYSDVGHVPETVDQEQRVGEYGEMQSVVVKCSLPLKISLVAGAHLLLVHCAQG